ncbi:MAG: tRNA (N(6)-L-threonylcarbamoyladenosine(37)-C(2))-methylthiotransferase MtaB [Desulfobacteraceae bacterium]|nr:MAG: tRNA (N(6)-L-threonylcarbamoyladenosine(37)-C(2))-methylthiotransferase MtaB [Desulfobacteraceae bacterium]
MMRKTYTFKIITFGCKVNQYESAYIGEKLKEHKWIEAEIDQPANVCIINTCIVTERAAFQSRQAVRRAQRANPHAKIAMTGCYAQVYEKELLTIPNIHLLSGNVGKAELPGAIVKLMDENQTVCGIPEFTKNTVFEPMPIRSFLDRTRAFLKIQDGCESYCSYCIVPYSRGPLRSLAPELVIQNLHALVREGYREVVLTGIHLGKYGSDRENRITLADLLTRIGNEKLSLRVRLSSLEPQEVSEELIAMMASENWLCRHLHIPLQSGDDTILKKMNRHYTTRDFASLIERIRSQMPLAAIGVDVMVGFPGETEPFHQNTLALIRDLPVSYLHVFPFSKRKGTPASAFPDPIAPETVKKRAETIRIIGLEKKRLFYESCLNREFRVLAEGWHAKSRNRIKGWSDNYLPIAFQSPFLVHNQWVQVVTEEVKGDVLTGKVKE